MQKHEDKLWSGSVQEFSPVQNNLQKETDRYFVKLSCSHIPHVRIQNPATTMPPERFSVVRRHVEYQQLRVGFLLLPGRAPILCPARRCFEPRGALCCSPGKGSKERVGYGPSCRCGNVSGQQQRYGNEFRGDPHQ